MFQNQITQQMGLLNQAYIEELFRVQFSQLTINDVVPFWSFSQGGIPLNPGVFYYGFLAIDDAYNWDGNVVDSPRYYNTAGTTTLPSLHQQLGLWPEIQNAHHFIGWKILCQGTAGGGIQYPDPPDPIPSDLEALSILNHFYINAGSPYLILGYPSSVQALIYSQYVEDVGVTLGTSENEYTTMIEPDNGNSVYYSDIAPAEGLATLNVVGVTKEQNIDYSVLPAHNLPFEYLGNGNFNFKGASDFMYQVQRFLSTGEPDELAANIAPGTYERNFYNHETDLGFVVTFTKTLGTTMVPFQFLIAK